MPGLGTAPDESGLKPPSGGAVPSPAIHRRAAEGETPDFRDTLEDKVEDMSMPRNPEAARPVPAGEGGAKRLRSPGAGARARAAGSAARPDGPHPRPPRSLARRWRSQKARRPAPLS